MSRLPLGPPPVNGAAPKPRAPKARKPRAPKVTASAPPSADAFRTEVADWIVAVGGLLEQLERQVSRVSIELSEPGSPLSAYILHEHIHQASCGLELATNAFISITPPVAPVEFPDPLGLIAAMRRGSGT